MKGFVLTPPDTVDTMVELLFHTRPPTADNTVLDPGCGTGEFIDGVLRWCESRRSPLPQITGVESDPRHLPALEAKFGRQPAVRIEHADFLTGGRSAYDYIIGNPPYVAITELSEAEKARYRARYATASGRFDLYLLFFEEAIRRLAPCGRLVFITPEKYRYVESAGPLRDLLAHRHVEQIRLVREDTCGSLVTHPTITVVDHAPPETTRIVQRDGTVMTARLPRGRGSWLPVVGGDAMDNRDLTLGDLCLRISCGVATGAHNVFVRSQANLEPGLRGFAYPTIAGRELTPATTGLEPRFAMLVPYDKNSRLLPLERLGTLRSYLTRKDVRRRLLARTCVKRKPWYAFHETPPLRDILRPKILCKDIGETPRFWVDRSGDLVPRHSVLLYRAERPGRDRRDRGVLGFTSRARVAEAQLPARSQGLRTPPERCSPAAARARRSCPGVPGRPGVVALQGELRFERHGSRLFLSPLCLSASLTVSSTCLIG